MVACILAQQAHACGGQAQVLIPAISPVVGRMWCIPSPALATYITPVQPLSDHAPGNRSRAVAVILGAQRTHVTLSCCCTMASAAYTSSPACRPQAVASSMPHNLLSGMPHNLLCQQSSAFAPGARHGHAQCRSSKTGCSHFRMYAQQAGCYIELAGSAPCARGPHASTRQIAEGAR